MARPVQVRAPTDPTPAEVEEHESTGHVQYRTWCRHCVAGRGVGQQHRTREEEARSQDGLPTIACDYTYMTVNGVEDERAKPILVIKDSKTWSVAATFVDQKGPTTYAVKYFSNFLKMLGYKRALFQSDGEHAIVALKTQAAAAAGVECVPRESPVGAHAENGLAEQACKELKRHVRVLRSSLEEKLGQALGDTDPVLAWMPRHVGDLLNRYRKGSDGKTPEPRRSGKAWRKPAIAFGERLYYREVGEGVRQLQIGRYIGHHGRTGWLLVMTDSGVKRGTGIRRLSPADQWIVEGWSELRGLPWEVAARRPGERAPALIGEDRLEVPDQPARVQLLPPELRRMYIRKQDVQRYGSTEGCPGCTCVLLDGPTTRPHTEACRARMVGLMQQDDQGRDRLEAHGRRKRERQEAPEQPVLEQDVAAEAAAGAPPAVERQEELPEVPEDPEERRAMKRASAEPEPKPAAKPKPEAPKGEKRPGGLFIRREPQAKVKLAERKGEKRAAAEDAEVLREETSGTVPETADPGTGDGSENRPNPPSQDVSSLSRTKEVLKAAIKRQVLNVYELHSIDIDHEEADIIATLGCEITAVDVMEVYSPKRFTEAAARLKLKPGFAVDLCETKPDGTNWDLNNPEDVRLVHQLVDEEEPKLLTGSPPCHMFSVLQNISWHKISPEIRNKRMNEALHHLHTSCELYKKQYEAGRWFLHEAPWGAASWKDPEIQELASKPGVQKVRGPMCRWEMSATDKRGLQGTGFVKKETGWLTNCKPLAEPLEGECTNTTGKAPWHRHIHLIGGLARQAAIYPPKLVKAVLQCLKKELERTGELNAVEMRSSGPVPEEPWVDLQWIEAYWDDVNGGWLSPEEVKKARQLEMDYLHKQGVYSKVPLQQCLDETGKQPIGTRWLDTNKGDPVKPVYRSRLVVREIKAAKRPEDQLPQNLLFSSTPPLEAMRLLCSLWSTKRVSKSNQRLKLGLWDISRAHFYGRPTRRIFIQLPPEEQTGGELMCGLLEKSMYGTQDAPAIWQAHYTALLESFGFVRGKSNASVFFREKDGARVLVHGDDFLALADKQGLEDIDSMLRSAYELKRLGTLGDEEGDDQEAHFLNRLLRVGSYQGSSAIYLEADRRHVDLLVKNLSMENAKGVDTPDVKKSADQQMLETKSPLLNKDLSSLYRSSVMRAAYLAQDRPDLGHAVKNLARKMVSPTEASMSDLKRLVRYVKKYADFTQVFGQQKEPDQLRIQVDSDHAGCAVTRRSTTGMVALYGTHNLKHSSNIQSTISLSTGESEYYALIKGGSVGLGLQSLLQDFGLSVRVVVESDSNAAKGTVNRQGLGKARHIQTRYLWIQERIARQDLKVLHVPGKRNRADVLTKSVPGVQMKSTMGRMNYLYLTERSKGQMKLLED